MTRRGGFRTELLYATAPDSFDTETHVLARTFAGYAAVALAHSHVGR